MIIKREDLFVSFSPIKNSSFEDFFQSFNEQLNNYKNENIIIDLTDFTVTIDDILKFNTISVLKTELGTSFVVVKSEVDLDEIPEELMVVPTFQEAVDIIDMDEMTRSLDF